MKKKNQFKYKVINRFYPITMVNEFGEGTPVNIISEVDDENETILITNGRHLQYCRKSQIQKINAWNLITVLLKYVSNYDAGIVIFKFADKKAVSLEANRCAEIKTSLYNEEVKFKIIKPASYPYLSIEPKTIVMEIEFVNKKYSELEE